ncbi:MAG: hypothetical protein GY948_21495 [Alphaproteobacteria bacterium]|nr:hypothetical protein [Alphaproteobacteria bacterium]
MLKFKKVRFASASHIALVMLTGAVLAGCAVQTNDELAGELSRESSFLVSDRYPIKVKKGVVRLKIPTGHGATFSDGREHEIRKFVADYPNTAAGHFVISIPSRGGKRANSVAGHLAKLASKYGVDPRQIRYRHHKGSRRAPVVVSYRRHFAFTKKCGNWPKSFTNTHDNKPYHNFGCSQQHNRAAMAANPRDLVTPRSLGESDQTRMGTVFEKWRSGESTASQRSEGESASVSQVQ